MLWILVLICWSLFYQFAGCCQTWIDHPIQADHARPRSDLHPHIFATKGPWRGTAHGLASLPSVLSVGSRHWSATGRLIPCANFVFGGFGHCSNGLQQQILLELYCAKLSELRRSPVILRLMPFYHCWMERTWKLNVRQNCEMTIRFFFWKMHKHGWLPSSIFPSSKFLPTRKLQRSAGHLRHISRPCSRRRPQEIRGQNGSPGGLGFKNLQNINPNPHTPCPQNWNWNSKSPSKHHSKWLLWSLASPLCVTSWARQLQPQLQCFKWHKTSRVWNIAITPSWCTEPTVASTVVVQLQLRPLEEEKASKSCKPGTSMRFQEISRFLKWLTSPNLIQIVSLILGFLATCRDTCGVSIWSWPLDKRHIHRFWNSASPSWLWIFDFGFSLKFVMIVVSDFGLPTHHKTPCFSIFQVGAVQCPSLG